MREGKLTCLAGAIVLVSVSLTVHSAAAITIAEEVAATGNTFQWAGESVTTPAGPGWNGLNFNFFNGGGDPLALGTLYLLDQEYLGSPDSLTTGATGFVAASTGISSGVYVFDPAVAISGNTSYFFYSDTVFSSIRVKTGLGDYQSSGASDGFGTFAGGFDWDYRLTGEAIPEPGCTALIAAASGLLLRRRRSSWLGPVDGII